VLAVYPQKANAGFYLNLHTFIAKVEKLLINVLGIIVLNHMKELVRETTSTFKSAHDL
jgi:hypothetical protein